MREQLAGQAREMKHVSRVLIADDHAVVRAGFKQFLEADPGINAVGEAASGNETLDLLRQQEWDLVLLDIHMPDRSGLDILRHIQTGHPSVRVSGDERFARTTVCGECPARRRQRLSLQGQRSGRTDESGSHRVVRTALCQRRARRNPGG